MRCIRKPVSFEGQDYKVEGNAFMSLPGSGSANNWTIFSIWTKVLGQP
jgi:hypothetical protein